MKFLSINIEFTFKPRSIRKSNNGIVLMKNVKLDIKPPSRVIQSHLMNQDILKVPEKEKLVLNSLR